MAVMFVASSSLGAIAPQINVNESPKSDITNSSKTLQENIFSCLINTEVSQTSSDGLETRQASFLVHSKIVKNWNNIRVQLGAIQPSKQAHVLASLGPDPCTQARCAQLAEENPVGQVQLDVAALQYPLRQSTVLLLHLNEVVWAIARVNKSTSMYVAADLMFHCDDHKKLKRIPKNSSFCFAIRQLKKLTANKTKFQSTVDAFGHV